MPGGLLAGLRVIEAAEGIAAPFCGRLLGHLGADVVKVEAPAGDAARFLGPFPGDAPHPEKSGLFLALNADKRGAVLDPSARKDRDRLLSFLESADLLVIDRPGEAAWPRVVEDARARNDRLIVTSLTPFGRSGSYRDFAASDLVIFHLSGYAPVVPGAVVDIDKEPPLRAGGEQAEFVTGLTAATAALMALALREVTGAGALVDVSAWEAMALMPQSELAEAALGRSPRARLDRVANSATVAIFPTIDGYIAISAREEHQWQAFLELLGNPEWSAEERFRTRAARQQNWPALEPLLSAWTRQQEKQALYRRLQAARVPAFPVNTAADLLESEQLRARGFFETIEHPVAGPLPYPGLPFKLSSGMRRTGRPAPLLGQHTAELVAEARSGQRSPRDGRQAAVGARLPLAGVRVLDLSWIIAGPTCTRLLGLMGADVIKVESRRRPDPTRGGASHAFLNQAKRSLSLNLSTPRGLEMALALAARCDIVVENFATGVVERMGLGYDALRRIKPDIIMLSSSGLGHSGPDREHVAYGSLLQCFTGWSSLTGYPGGRPLIGGVWSDPLTGMMQTFVLLAALRHREGTGEGCYIDLSMAEAMCYLLPEALIERAMNGRVLGPMGNRDRRHVPHNLYRCRGDDAWVAVAVTSEAEWRALCDALGQPKLAADPRFATPASRRANEEALDGLIGRWTASLRPAEVVERLQPRVPCGPSLSARDLLDDPHLRERGFFVECAGPEGESLRLPAVPWHIESAAAARATPPRPLGADTRAILQDLLALTSAEIDALEADGILY